MALDSPPLDIQLARPEDLACIRHLLARAQEHGKLLPEDYSWNLEQAAIGRFENLERCGSAWLRVARSVQGEPTGFGLTIRFDEPFAEFEGAISSEYMPDS